MQLCSVSLLAGLMILLRSATRITHKAQSVTSLATKWHVCATIESFEAVDNETPVDHVTNNRVFPVGTDGSSDGEDVGDEEDELDNTKLIPAYAYSTISFQKRQALGQSHPHSHPFFFLVLLYTKKEKENYSNVSCGHNMVYGLRWAHSKFSDMNHSRFMSYRTDHSCKKISLSRRACQMMRFKVQLH